MRIAVMLRAYDRPGGIGVYSQNILRNLLEIDKSNEYLLIFNKREFLGDFERYSNAKSVSLSVSNPIWWDQVSVAREASRWGADLIFNTKFSVPLITNRKRIMVLHGGSWFAHPELYGKLDIAYVNAAMPLYCRSCDHLISNSELTTKDFIEYLSVPASKITTIPLAADSRFQVVEDVAERRRVREKYSLPDSYVLTVTSYDPRKNFSASIAAFEKLRKRFPIHFVVIGKNCEAYAEEHHLEQRGLTPYVHFPGWVDQKDLPAIYSDAMVFLFPSVYEEFGIPVVEAMACGSPVVASNTGNIPELTRQAGMLADPSDISALARNLEKVVASQELADELRARGLERAATYSWEIAARRTLDVLEQVV